jgi:hypothetical protein
MDIIDRLLSQLSKIKSILIKEVESGSYTLNYNICEKEFKFLDKSELQKYLTNTDIKNSIFLKTINEKCLFIIDTWQKELQSIPYKELQDNLVVEGDFISIATKIDFHAFNITEKGIVIHNKIDFVKRYDYTLFDLSDIAARCNWILNFNTAAYPKTIPDEMIIKKVDKVKDVKKKLNDFFINMDESKKEDFYSELGKMFPNEIGKPIKAIINILKKEEIILIPDRQFKQFYDSLGIEFNRYIGTYTSINDVINIDSTYLESLEKKLKPLILKYKNK